MILLTVVQNVKTGVVNVKDVPPPILRPGHVLVQNHCSLVSAGTERAVSEFSKANYLKKASLRPDLVRKVLNKAKNDGLWDTYKVVSELIEQEIPLGYSSAGTVLSIGEGVDDIRVNDRVACAGLFLATHSDVVCVPRNLLARIPDNVDFEDASFITVGAIAMHAVRLAKLELAENVVVYGAGLVGLICAQLAIAAGCKVIGVDLDEFRLKQLESIGGIPVEAKEGFEQKIVGLTDGRGADKVLLCAATKSNEPIERVPAITRQKGILVVVGDVSMNVSRRAYYDKEIDIRVSRSYGPGRHDPSYEIHGIDYPFAYVRWTQNRNMEAILDLLSRKRVSFRDLITHRFSVKDAKSCYQLLETGSERYLGIVISYPSQHAASVSQTVERRRAQVSPGGKLRVGVIGGGNFAKAFLLPNFRSVDNVAIEGFCTASGVSSTHLAEKYDARFATADPDRILLAENIQAVIVATRHDTHADYAVRAMKAGKAMFVEKPLAISEEELERIKETYDQLMASGRAPLLFVGYNRRFSPLAKVLKTVFHQRKTPLSMIYRVNAGTLPGDIWQSDPRQGGRIVGEVCHFVDFMSFLTDSLPVSVHAEASGDDNTSGSCNVVLTLKFSDNSIGSINYFDCGSPALSKEYVEVFGDGKAAQLLNFKELTVQGAKIPGRKCFANQLKGYKEEVEAFVDCLTTNAPAPISFDSLYATCKVTLLAHKSLATGKSEPVSR